MVSGFGVMAILYALLWRQFEGAAALDLAFRDEFSFADHPAPRRPRRKSLARVAGIKHDEIRDGANRYAGRRQSQRFGAMAGDHLHHGENLGGLAHVRGMAEQ